jgi:glyoxylase-like metal-dependent hydrolase (beta-lactamase superfamily II)
MAKPKIALDGLSLQNPKEFNMIVKQLIVGFFQVGCYIAGCEKTHQCVLIDPAGDEERIMATVNDLGLEVVATINTHGHPDHTCGNRKIAALTGAKTLMHRLDDEYFSSPAGEAMARQFGIEPSPPADTHIQDGERIEIGDTSLTVIHTPGHSPGGVCLYGENNLFTGDTLFVGAVGRTDFAGGSLDTLLESIKTKILTLPDDTIIWPGHDYGVSPTSTVGNERKTNPYLAGLS